MLGHRAGILRPRSFKKRSPSSRIEVIGCELWYKVLVTKVRAVGIDVVGIERVALDVHAVGIPLR